MQPARTAWDSQSNLFTFHQGLSYKEKLINIVNDVYFYIAPVDPCCVCVYEFTERLSAPLGTWSPRFGFGSGLM